jgi:hypothetical protein
MDGRLSREAELSLLQWQQDMGRVELAAPWDAMCGELVSLSDLAQDELLVDPYSALADDGIDAYTGADTVLDGSHDHALMMAGWAMLEVDDED